MMCRGLEPQGFPLRVGRTRVFKRELPSYPFVSTDDAIEKLRLGGMVVVSVSICHVGDWIEARDRRGFD